MRRILLPGLAFGFAATACAATTRPDAQAQTPAGAAQSEQGTIVIREQTNVCVSVHVDQRIWPRPLSENADLSFSNLLAFELGRHHQRRGGALILPGGVAGGNLDPRFVANVDGGSRFCRRDSDDIYVTVRYMPRPDGNAFAANYRIEQGSATRTGSFARDLIGEERAGRIRNPHPGSVVPYAIAMDIRARADLLIAQIR